jgi:hypothetical protein
LLEWKKTKEELAVQARVNAELKKWSEASKEQTLSSNLFYLTASEQY